MGAAIISSQEPIAQVYWVSEALFAAASLLGLWLIISMAIPSGTLREQENYVKDFVKFCDFLTINLTLWFIFAIMIIIK
jgi:hypothetical protein